MHIWHVKIMMRGERAAREQPLLFKEDAPVKNGTISDLIVDGIPVRGRITAVRKACQGSGFDVEAEQIV